MGAFRLGKGACGPLVALCALVAVLWAGSYRSVAQVRSPVSAGGTRANVTSFRGVLVVALIEDHPVQEGAVASVRRAEPEAAALWDDQHWSASFAGFCVEDAQVWVPNAAGERVVRRWKAINLPYWLLFAVAVAGPLSRVCRAVRAHRRLAHDQCGECGYDLGGGAVCQACAARAQLIGVGGGSRGVRLVQPTPAV